MVLDPQAQAENLEYMKLLALVMWKQGIEEISLTDKEIAAMPDDKAVVIGPNPDDRTIRIRLMDEEAAKRERGWPGSSR